MANSEYYLPFQPALQNVLQLKNYQQITQSHQGISHFYSFTATDHPDSNKVIIPDNCIDILFNCDSSKPEVRVYGTVSRCKPVELVVDNHYFGIRFMPGIIPNYINLSPEDMPDNDYNLMEVISDGEDILESIVSCTDFSQQVQLYNTNFSGKPLIKPSQVTQHLISKVIRQNGNIKINELEKDIGYSSRNIQRIFLGDTGVGLKQFSRYLRMQTAITMLGYQPNDSLTDIATELGFSDQSHFIKDFKMLTGISPRKMRAQFLSKTFPPAI